MFIIEGYYIRIGLYHFLCQHEWWAIQFIAIPMSLWKFRVGCAKNFSYLITTRTKRHGGDNLDDFVNRWGTTNQQNYQSDEHGPC